MKSQKVSGLPKGAVGGGECMLAVNRTGLHICTAEFHVRKCRLGEFINAFSSIS